MPGPLPPANDDDPRVRDLSRRSKTSATGPWVWFALILLGGAVIYVLSGF